MASRRNTIKQLTRIQRANLQARFYLVGPELPFKAEEERRAAWEENRAELLKDSRPGLRPGAFWNYDHPEIDAERLPLESDRQLLHRFQMLEPAEIEQLKEWRCYPPKPAGGKTPDKILMGR